MTFLDQLNRKTKGKLHYLVHPTTWVEDDLLGGLVAVFPEQDLKEYLENALDRIGKAVGVSKTSGLYQIDGILSEERFRKYFISLPEKDVFDTFLLNLLCLLAPKNEGDYPMYPAKGHNRFDLPVTFGTDQPVVPGSLFPRNIAVATGSGDALGFRSGIEFLFPNGWPLLDLSAISPLHTHDFVVPFLLFDGRVHYVVNKNTKLVLHPKKVPGEGFWDNAKLLARWYLEYPDREMSIEGQLTTVERLDPDKARRMRFLSGLLDNLGKFRDLAWDNDVCVRHRSKSLTEKQRQDQKRYDHVECLDCGEVYNSSFKTHCCCDLDDTDASDWFLGRF